MTDTLFSPIRRIDAKRWLLLGTAAAAGLSAGTAVSAAPVHGSGLNPPVAGYTHLVAGEVAAQGGEGGETGAAHSDDENANYLAELIFLEGHLRVANALYAAGVWDEARRQSTAPVNEIYTEISPDLAGRGAEAFDDRLAALAAAMANGAPTADTDAAYASVLHEIDEAGEKAGGKTAARLRAIAIVVADVAADFDAGVDDGTIVELKEYQDAWGYLQVVHDLVGELGQSTDPAVQKALTKIAAQVAVMDAAFAGVMPGADAPLGDPETLFGAAARIELAALSVH